MQNFFVNAVRCPQEEERSVSRVIAEYKRAIEKINTIPQCRTNAAQSDETAAAAAHIMLKRAPLVGQAQVRVKWFIRHWKKILAVDFFQQKLIQRTFFREIIDSLFGSCWLGWERHFPPREIGCDKFPFSSPGTRRKRERLRTQIEKIEGSFMHFTATRASNDSFSSSESSTKFGITPLNCQRLDHWCEILVVWIISRLSEFGWKMPLCSSCSSSSSSWEWNNKKEFGRKTSGHVLLKGSLKFEKKL